MSKYKSYMAWESAVFSMYEYSFAKKFVDLPMKTHFTSNDLSINLFSANIKVCIVTACVNDLILANSTLAYCLNATIVG